MCYNFVVKNKSGPPLKGDGALREEKQALRKKTEEKRKLLGQREIAESNRLVAEKLLALPQYARANMIFCFVGTASEIATKPIILRALAEGKRVCVPKCLEPGVMRAYEITALGDLGPGAYGIDEPREGCRPVEPSEIDFAVIPCVTCNARGHRLGHGGGFYDRYLANQTFETAVLCRAALMSEDIPVQGHDLPVGTVITG
jgi:5-formyltetrahydrofolate cyclo-ligase